MKTTKFKPSEVGPIPEEWECLKIGDMASVCTGDRNTQDKIDSGAYPFYVRSPIVERINDYGFDTEGVITVGDGVGTGKVFHYVNGKFALHQRCYLIDSFDDRLHAKYFYKIFSERFYDRVMQMTAKSSVDSVRREMITGMWIPVPPRPEQEKIAEALSDMDALLAAMTTLIEKKRAIKQGAMQQLLGMRNDELGMRNEPIRRLAGFSGTWVEKRLGEVCELLDNRRIPLNDSQRKQGPYPYCGANGVVDYIDRYVFDESVILIAEDGGNFADYASKPIAYQMSGKFWVNNHAHVLIAKEGYSQSYIFTQLEHKDITDIISGGTRAKLTRGQLVDLSIMIPPTLAEQKAIAAVLSDMDAEIAALESKRAKYESIKQGMMQELLTGWVRLVGWPDGAGLRNTGD